MAKLNRIFKMVLATAAAITSQMTFVDAAGDVAWDTSVGYNCCRNHYSSGMTAYFYGDCIPYVTQSDCK